MVISCYIFKSKAYPRRLCVVVDVTEWHQTIALRNPLDLYQGTIYITVLLISRHYQLVRNKIDTLLLKCDWYKFSLLAAITETTKNSSQSPFICFKVNLRYL